MMSLSWSLWRLCAVVSLLLSVSTFILTAAQSNGQLLPGKSESWPLRVARADVDVGTHTEVYETNIQDVAQTHIRNPPTVNASTSKTPSYTASRTNILQDLHNALETMQSSYFSIWLGKYTTAIDWTAAVMSTHVSATLASLSRSLTYTMPGTFDKSKTLDVEAQMVENEINKYFGQITTYYFGEDHFAIRMQAYDDILWVVLGWLESINFIEQHAAGHYDSGSQQKAAAPEWHARQFIPSFAHRARVFYELAEKGWDWRLCGGGMTWNPRLLPYKNAITNQLFISASVGMYLHFPGDANCSPFLSQYDDKQDGETPSDELLHAQEHGEQCDESVRGDSSYDPIYLANAIHGYDWLKNSGMVNDQGLYVDGFHIAGYRTNHSKTECNERNEMVYTYNQGVVLSGLRGLWEATGNTTYLEDGHELVRNVIRATGWTDERRFTATSTRSETPAEPSASRGAWAGLGAHGILAEACDPAGTCSQDGQTFKGIFFHHLTAFCAPLPSVPVSPGRTYAASRETGALHSNSCSEYTDWVVRNARAALGTRDDRGRFGGWWGVGRDGGVEVDVGERVNETDYRNFPTQYEARFEGVHDELADGVDSGEVADFDAVENIDEEVKATASGDLNDRGRGRSVETQGGGVAVVRAMLEFIKLDERG